MPSAPGGGGQGRHHLHTQWMKKETEAQRGGGTRPRSHSEAQIHQDLPTLNLSPLEPYARVRGSRTARVLTLPAPNPHTRPLCPPTPLPLGPQWTLPQTRLLGGALRRGRTSLGQARSGRVLCSPRSEDDLRQVPDGMDAAFSAKTNFPTPICNKPKSREPRLKGAAAGLPGCGTKREGRDAGNRAEPERGHPANHH